MNAATKQSQSAISLDQFLALPDFEPAAKQVLPHPVYEYIASGAGNEITLTDNERAYDRIRIWPRVLNDVRSVDTTVSLFGKTLVSPIILAPAAYQGAMHPLGERATVRGAGRAGIPFVVSTNTTVAIEELIKEARAPLWFQLYTQNDRKITENLIGRVETAGCEGICVTADTPVLGVRTRQLRAGFQLPPGVSTPHNVRGGGASGNMDPSLHSPLQWEDIAWLRSLVRTKLWLKGILHPDDADRAINLGVDGIMVSNHGARNLDTMPATIDLLPAIHERVAGRVPVIVDGGIRRGTDVLKALMRGATAVMIGRPYLYALAVGGEDGVARCIDLLTRELTYVLRLVGQASVKKLDRSLEWPPLG
ncbi:MAG: alpha-hydroxy-acid oxidizing protein [Verrucomicrobia bacterium]|nr:alpha-hydroxy-acid oxidizing protein [Verrucomicrobiota bacterium]MBV8483692.1 alpha-hydroxy-acid oxidizing protein [Verrucomicrobiota bacterium]